MGQDYAALAKQLGGTAVAPVAEPAAVDYAAIAREVNATPPRAPGLATIGDQVSAKGGVGTFLSRAASRLNPVAAAQAMGKMVIPEAAARLMGAGTEEAEQYGPLNTLRHMGQATQGVFEQAKQAYDQGDYGSAAIKAMFGAIPVVGPDFNQMGDHMRQGHYAEALGDATGLGLSTVAPAVVGNVSARVGKVLPSAQTAADRAAVAFGRSRGVPIDAGTATGNRYVKNVQGLADHSPFGSVIAERAKTAQGAALRRVAGEVKDQARMGAIDAVGAGERIAGALEQKIVRHAGEATTAYERLRQFEASATPQTVSAGTTTTTQQVSTGAVSASGAPITQAVTSTQPATAQMRMAVDTRPAKASLQPIYDRLKREAELVPLQGGKAKALTALDRLLTGPDHAPLSLVDEALGDLKSMARTSDLPELRTQGQGVAAEAVTRLDAQVRARAAQAGPDVLKALEEGRAATIAKYETADARELIAGKEGASEPRAVFNRLTANDDAGVVKLRAVQAMTPKELPAIGRALLEDVLERPLAEGGFQFGAKAQADWLRIGAETKRRLFPKPGQVEGLDQFFLLAKKLSESPNPSQSGLIANAGTQTVLAVTNPALGIPVVLGSAALSKILHSPKAVQFLTTGLRLSVNAKPAAQAAAAAQIGRAASTAGVAMPLPAAAEAPPGRRP